MRATLDLAAKLPTSDFAAWLSGGWFSVWEGESLKLFTKILHERWKVEDPEVYATWILKNKSKDATAALASMAESEPRKILDLFSAHPDAAMEIQILASVANNHADLALQRLKEIAASLSSNDQSLAGPLVQQLAKQAPEALENSLGSLPLGLRTQAEVILISKKMETSFSSELQRLVDRPEGIKLLQSLVIFNESFKSKLCDELPKLPVSWRVAIGGNSYAFIGPESAGKWAGADLVSYGFTPLQASTIRTQALAIYALSDPEAALKALGGMNLPAGQREPLIRNMFQFVHDKPEKSAAMLALLESDDERKIAGSVIANQATPRPGQIDRPEDWLEKVVASDLEQPGSAQYLSVLKRWDDDKIAILTDRFIALQTGESKLKLAKYLAGNVYSENGPLEGEAIRYLVSRDVDIATADHVNPSDAPDEESGVSTTIRLASNYVREVARKDPRSASAWLQTLPEGEPKLWARKSLHTVWMKYDPTGAERWLKSLPAGIQTTLQEQRSIDEDVFPE